MSCERAKIMVRGAVQGVGFRPFVYKLATELRLNGWVLNSSQGVQIEVEGGWPTLQQFLLRLEKEKPPHATIHSLEYSLLDAVGHDGFEIRHSTEGGAKVAVILPDLATCPDCLREVFDPHNRRHLYPFTNCTNCGPRFSIIEGLPYDRSNTSMKEFTMCAECKAEYDNPGDRRFHAQPNACPKCGPHLELWDVAGRVLARNHDALLQAASAVRHGEILALKGLGGFHLIVDARAEDAVLLLRKRKRREDKPFALMYPSLEAIRLGCEVSELEERLLRSSESPIVLLERHSGVAEAQAATNKESIASSIAPHNPTLGVMLPYTPLHHLLLRELGFPVVATSGNLTNEPICIDEREALERLHGVADLFLVHNRPIARHMDDSVVRIMLGRELVLRRSRGYAPLPVHLKEQLPNILAVGAHLKNTVALSVGSDIFISQHIGDLETKEAYSAFSKVTADLQRLYEITPEFTACDLHPDFLSSKFAQRTNAVIVRVQHHYAHVLACMAENELEAPVLGLAWDGTGYGADGTIWGGEFLLVGEDSFERAGHFRPFRLPGGEVAIKQPRRSAVGVLYEIFGDKLFERADPVLLANFSNSELSVLRQALKKQINTPRTSSVGRLFDAVASLVGLRQRAGFEGQAAMDLEFAIRKGIEDAYSFEVKTNGTLVVDWQPMILEIIKEVRREEAVGVIAAKFHNTLAEVAAEMSHRVDNLHVVLTGGCFQNKYLLERTVQRLREEGFRPYWHQRVPPNDGGIALGQVMAAVRASVAAKVVAEPCVQPELIHWNSGALPDSSSS
ncbi:carbamoyltransferase HypF [Pedosphaera parvula]|uniref:Carbamoyltransferase n=1 Tax=Pedosphaera parvula (strain Ellin514) TaxID=320771 RepID=B9XAS8_PEDPL|nr:carbamoyltransferase HypF [Pedosphaera parvula]EEF63113.1 (NiFe) hydrogenase maturation protein HypF [Pedosphaera parvula Ellin514]